MFKVLVWLVCVRFNSDRLRRWSVGWSIACIHGGWLRHSAITVQVVCENAAVW